jgi:hypothetical protein
MDRLKNIDDYIMDKFQWFSDKIYEITGVDSAEFSLIFFKIFIISEALKGILLFIISKQFSTAAAVNYLLITMIYILMLSIPSYLMLWSKKLQSSSVRFFNPLRVLFFTFRIVMLFFFPFDIFNFLKKPVDILSLIFFIVNVSNILCIYFASCQPQTGGKSKIKKFIESLAFSTPISVKVGS